MYMVALSLNSNKPTIHYNVRFKDDSAVMKTPLFMTKTLPSQV